MITGIPLLAHGGANIPYSLTREEAAAAGINQGAALERKQRASTAWKELTVGAGFSFTGIGLGFLMWCYCCGGLGRLHRGLDYPPMRIEPDTGAGADTQADLEDPRPNHVPSR